MRVKFDLRRWAGFLEHRNILDDQTKKEAGQFFRGLQRLEQEEVRLLHEKYVTGVWITYDNRLGVYFNNLALSDSEIAKKRGIKLEGYRLKRQITEKKLQHFINEERQASDEAEKQALEQFHLVVGTNLYLKRYEVGTRFPTEVIAMEVTPNEQEAKTCTPVDEMKLKRHGFQRKKMPCFDL